MGRKYLARPEADCYGFAIGIILIDTRAPFIAGDVGNASSYDFPVLYRTVPGATVERVLKQGDETLTDSIVSVAKDLEKMGVRAISSDCGFMISFQKKVAASVDVPVILSSLLLLPLLERAIPRNQKIGLITANRKRLTSELLKVAGLGNHNSIVAYGMEEQPHFCAPILDESGTLEPDEVEKEVVAVATEMVRDHPEVGPILLECASLPPYAHAIQQTTGRSVFDFITLINLFSAAAFRTPFHGIY